MTLGRCRCLALALAAAATLAAAAVLTVAAIVIGVRLVSGPTVRTGGGPTAQGRLGRATTTAGPTAHERRPSGTRTAATPEGTAAPRQRTAAPRQRTAAPRKRAAAPPERAAAPADSTATPVPALDPAQLAVSFRLVVSGLQDPVAIAAPGDGSGRLFVVERSGRIRIVRAGVLLAAPFLDLTDRVESGATERGLLGLVFHPRYAAGGDLFVAYTTAQPERVGAREVGAVVYARYRASADPDRADPASEQVVIWWEHPRGNHNGGHMAFGPRDGYLYLGTGDGGGTGDPDRHAQDPGSLLGKLLRLDVDRALRYAVPPTNPFAAQPNARPEVWATGLRNPWRFSFDRATGDLYVADVGEAAREEVDFQPADSPGGENYGWRIMEGTRCYAPAVGCRQGGLTLPVAEYSHDLGCAVTGGHVYRGHAFPRLTGTYLYTDWCSGRTWGLNRDPAGEWRSAEVGRLDARVQSYGEDEDGELYVVSDDGRLWQLVDGRPSDRGDRSRARRAVEPPGP